MHFWNAEGIRDEQRDYLTASALLLYRNWNLATSYTGRFIDAADGSDRTDTLFQVSGGYTFDFGLEADVGYRLVEEDSITSHTVGVFFVYDYGFIF